VIPPKPTPAQVAHVHLDECQMVVLPGPGRTSFEMARAAQSHMEQYFNELGIPLRNPAGVKLDSTTRARVAGISRSEDADLVAVVTVEVTEIDRLGSSVRMKADAACKIYESGGDIFVTATSTGDVRDNDPQVAAAAAIDGALEALGLAVADRMIDRVGRTAMTRRVSISGLDSLYSLTELQRSLGEQRGIKHVRRVSWDAVSGVAKLTVYMTPEVVDNLGSYIEGTPGLGIDIVYDGGGAIVGHDER
jgi:hypothetical protein